jgi:hypothetical protein
LKKTLTTSKNCFIIAVRGNFVSKERGCGMLYKPNFCCQCGEAIERIEWKLWNSRRFCENCEKEFRSADWLPRMASGIMILGGLFGIGSFLKGTEKPLNGTANQLAVSSANNPQNTKIGQTAADSKEPNPAVSQTLGASVVVSPNREMATPKIPFSAQSPIQPVVANQKEEPVTFCGAQTKKGTPCTRKVKGEGRCWQHTGLPAMLPKEKLIVSQ